MNAIFLSKLSGPLACMLLLGAACLPAQEIAGPQIPGTKPLTLQGDIAAQMVDGIDRFLLSELEASIARRASFWKRDFSSAERYQSSLEPNRQRLAHILGVRDARIPFEGLELVSSTAQSHVVGQGQGYQVFAVRWPVVRNIHGEGLLLVPDQAPVADVIAVPDADQTPEMLSGLSAGLEPQEQFARLLVENGCRVLVPQLINREIKPRGGRGRMTNREYLYRSSFELGRHLIGYEVQKILAGVDWFAREAGDGESNIGLIGYGEGAMLALYAAALDERIAATALSGYFGSRQRLWEQPLDRNVFGLLEQFGDAELASMIVPRSLVIQGGGGPQLELISDGGGAPGILQPVPAAEVQAEFARLQQLVAALPGSQPHGQLLATKEKTTTAAAARALWSHMSEQPSAEFQLASTAAPQATVDQSAQRHERQFEEIVEHNQWLLAEALATRTDFMNIGLTRGNRKDGANHLDTSSPAAYEKSVERFREYFRHEVVGHFDRELLECNPRTRKLYDEPTWTGYEVMLDVFPDVFSYGVLCVPKTFQPGEKRPVVVCQHGLEGRPEDVLIGDHRAYHDFASKLVERGYITFAPQNPYIGKDRFRTLQRKANPLKKTLFSVIVPQHQQILNWLKTLPQVDGERIGFYGLSYGGKSAMRIPPLVTDYSLSICSADFNEWVDKNASTRGAYSYMWTGEYEIFEFDLGSTFNYAEMAALIAPRPFMVERGHFDGVGTDENVAYEFARVRHLYAARLGLADRCAIEWFVGPHAINAQGTFEFLDQHLKNKR